MKIRKATRIDSEEIYKLLTELKTDDFNKNTFKELFDKELQKPYIYHLVATDGGDLIGYLGGKIEERLMHDRKVATIEIMIVSSKHRGHGVGQKMFSCFEVIVNKNKCDKVEVCSKIERNDAHRFYTEKVGMKKTNFGFSKNYK